MHWILRNHYNVFKSKAILFPPEYYGTQKKKRIQHKWTQEDVKALTRVVARIKRANTETRVGRFWELCAGALRSETCGRVDVSGSSVRNKYKETQDGHKPNWFARKFGWAR